MSAERQLPPSGGTVDLRAVFAAACESVGGRPARHACARRLGAALAAAASARHSKGASRVGSIDDLAAGDDAGCLAELSHNQYANVQRPPVAMQKLAKILNKPEWRCLLGLHDAVLAKQYSPVLPAVPHEVDEDDGVAVKIVRLVRNNEPLGATIKCEEGGAVVVARIMRGGVADRSGCIQVGDRVLEVNNVSVTGKQPADIVKLLVGDGQTVTFKLVPVDEESDGGGGETHSDRPQSSRAGSEQSSSQQQHGGDASAASGNARVRALFAYEPRGDALHPCPEAGLCFGTGDVLEVVDDGDRNWWQVRLEKQGALSRPLNCSNASGGMRRSEFGRVALVPSNHLQMRRNRAASQQQQSGADSPKHGGPAAGSPIVCGPEAGDRRRRHQQQQQRLMYAASSADDLMGADESAKNCYESVGLLYPRLRLVRPLVLLGPAGVGRNELQRRLLMAEPDRFATTVPHTSRPPRAGETDGVEYNFASRPQMDEWVKLGRFLEHGEYKGNVYGTLIDSVAALVRANRTPVLAPHPQALRLLRTADIRPFVIFVKPPPFPALKETRCSSHATHQTANYARSFTDQELRSMIQAADAMQLNYGQWFDYELVNGALEFAFRELCDVVQRLEKEPQWVPLSWIA